MALFEWKKQRELEDETAEEGEEEPLSPFRACLARELGDAFLNLQEFGEKRTIRYDGVDYEDIPVVLDQTGLQNRYDIKQMKTDYSQGLLKSVTRLFCRQSDLDGQLPEEGMSLGIESLRQKGFFYRYTISTSALDEGMITLELKEIDE
jgi:hypothetical protein